ncbi:type II toxin-antitoxin system RelE/ParE family toxin [Stenotrophomonas sp. PS02289]|uniref:type II toxin-antitoxin system RelE/ParE family toxin n=1 Tax=Stenotrophomonas sp. PS02289 TaxID=2991422 RepID=UPI00249A7FCD|nr:type II toxin-antitoxin system RelE/ParE family toxin [Stenotrophomonas sp. PS02289]
MHELEWSQAARGDLLEIVSYIAEDNPDAAQWLMNDINSAAMRLQEFPKMHRAGRVDGTREVVVRSNYIVVYAEDEATVRILRVLHAARQWPPDR